MKVAVFAALFQAVAISLSSAYPITGTTVNCRSGPGTHYPVKKTYAKGSDVKVICQTTGTSIKGNNIWDKTQDGCYVTDYYVKTGINGFVTTKCPSGGSSTASIPGSVTDDYPYKGKCGGVDPWNYYKCQCTSFVAWRINERLGVHFHNQYKGVNWGNANSWDNAARKTGVTVNNKPVPGCVAQSNAGGYGHVAWVTAVGPTTVTIEEYNYGSKEGYGRRTVPKGNFNYIHIKV